MISTYLRDFSHLIFPIHCSGCDAALDENEALLCDDCLAGLPQTRYWLQTENSVEKLFWGKIPIERASAYLFFTKGGMVQQMLHGLKYKGREEIGSFLGESFGKHLANSPYKEVDVVVPVPLHVSKLKKRGYNQCASIARMIAKQLGAAYVDSALQRLEANESQTRKGRYERWLNVNALFKVSEPEVFSGKHILIVDDVVTTGATLEACAGAVLEVEATRVSLATIACPSLV